MPALTEIEVNILIDENGSYAVETDIDNLKDRYESDIAELNGTLAYRLVKLTVKVPTPTPAVATITVPALPSDAVVALQGPADDADTDVVEPA